MPGDAFPPPNRGDDLSEDVPAVVTVEEIEERLKAMIDAPFAAHLNMETVSIGDGEAVVRMPIEGMTNALGAAHGGAIFSVADQAFALACNSSGDVQVGISASINYLRPAKEGLEARARRVGENKSTSVYEVLVYDKDTLVAVFQGIGYRLRKRNGTK